MTMHLRYADDMTTGSSISNLCNENLSRLAFYGQVNRYNASYKTSCLPLVHEDYRQSLQDYNVLPLVYFSMCHWAVRGLRLGKCLSLYLSLYLSVSVYISLSVSIP